MPHAGCDLSVFAFCRRKNRRRATSTSPKSAHGTSLPVRRPLPGPPGPLNQITAATDTRHPQNAHATTPRPRPPRIGRRSWLTGVRRGGGSRSHRAAVLLAVRMQTRARVATAATAAAAPPRRGTSCQKQTGRMMRVLVMRGPRGMVIQVGSGGRARHEIRHRGTCQETR